MDWLVSMCAGLTLSNDTTSWRPCLSMVIVFLPWRRTLKGPSYGACSDLRTTSLRRKMWLHDSSSLLTYMLLSVGCRGGVGRSFVMM